MKKIVLVFSFLSILLGAITLIITSILSELIPKIGYVAFQSAMKGSYTPNSYEMNFSFANIIAIILIISGSVISYKMYLLYHNK